jgi:hypothetical protein
MGNRPWIEAPHRIVDPELERVVYGTGDRVPIHDAVKYGLISADEVELGPVPPGDEKPAEPKAKRRGRRPKPADAPAKREAGPAGPDEAR